MKIAKLCASTIAIICFSGLIGGIGLELLPTKEALIVTLAVTGGIFAYLAILFNELKE